MVQIHSSSLKNKRVALVYDRVNKWGGAERVLLCLHELFPDAPLYTSVYNPKTAPWAKVFQVKTSWLQKLPGVARAHELFPFLMPMAFESFSFDAYDIVISVSSESAKGILTKPQTLHINYCLTPTRYLWSGYTDYFRNHVTRFLSFPIVSYLRVWDRVAAKRPDMIIAISQEVKKRIKKYYNCDAPVLYPPVGLTEKKQNNAPQPLLKKAKVHQLQKKGYFLVVSRLVPYKRIDIAIEACNQLKLPLVVIGAGSEENKLRELAEETITFERGLTDAELVEYYKGCRALIFPGTEDFGLVLVEAQRFGKPVIALKAGGAEETVTEGKTGVFFTEQNAQSLQQILATFDEKQFAAEDCYQQAKAFSEDSFRQAFLQIVTKE